jgi:hypothetical protein
MSKGEKCAWPQRQWHFSLWGGMGVRAKGRRSGSGGDRKRTVCVGRPAGGVGAGLDGLLPKQLLSAGTLFPSLRAVYPANSTSKCTTEVLKLILGIGNSLAGRLLLYDALDVEFRVFNVQKNRACPLCGEKPTITGVGASGNRKQPDACPV